MTQEKYTSSLSRQSSETKPSTKLVLVSREPLLYLEFNKPNKQNFHEINLFEKFNFFQSQNSCDWLMSEMKHQNITSLNQLK